MPKFQKHHRNQLNKVTGNRICCFHRSVSQIPSGGLKKNVVKCIAGIRKNSKKCTVPKTNSKKYENRPFQEDMSSSPTKDFQDLYSLLGTQGGHCISKQKTVIFVAGWWLFLEFVKLLSIQYPPLKGQPIRKCDSEMLMLSQKTAAHFFSTSRTKHSSVR